MSQPSKPLIPRLRCLATLLQQLNAQTACDAVNEAIESIESTEALRQSQSLPAGAVAEIGELNGTKLIVGRNEEALALLPKGTKLYALQADAREKGEAVDSMNIRLNEAEAMVEIHSLSVATIRDFVVKVIKDMDLAREHFSFSGNIEAAAASDTWASQLASALVPIQPAKASEQDDGFCGDDPNEGWGASHKQPWHEAEDAALATQPAQASEKADFWALERGCAALLGGSTWAVMPADQKREARETLAAALATSSQETASE